MDIRLIYPSGRRFDSGAPLKKQAKAHRYPGMGLTMVAALTPPGAAITIVDDEREPVDYERPADLVGISILTPNARRGYQIAREYRKRGVPVVLGGIHATACPEEAAGEADADRHRRGRGHLAPAGEGLRGGPAPEDLPFVERCLACRAARSAAGPPAQERVHHGQHRPGDARLSLQLRILLHGRAHGAQDALPPGRGGRRGGPAPRRTSVRAQRRQRLPGERLLQGAVRAPHPAQEAVGRERLVERLAGHGDDGPDGPQRLHGGLRRLRVHRAPGRPDQGGQVGVPDDAVPGSRAAAPCPPHRRHRRVHLRLRQRRRDRSSRGRSHSPMPAGSTPPRSTSSCPIRGRRSARGSSAKGGSSSAIGTAM